MVFHKETMHNSGHSYMGGIFCLNIFKIMFLTICLSMKIVYGASNLVVVVVVMVLVMVKQIGVWFLGNNSNEVLCCIFCM